MRIDAANPGRSFEALWNELEFVVPAGSCVSKFHGMAFTIMEITDSKVILESPGENGARTISRSAFEIVYSDWRNYRYENLSPDNSEEILNIISIISKIVQTWVRRAQRDELIEKVRKTRMPDAMFWLVEYNLKSRSMGPRPAGEPIQIDEAFPGQSMPELLKIEEMAIKLFNAYNQIAKLIRTEESPDAHGALGAKYPGFSKDVYGSVVFHAMWVSR